MKDVLEITVGALNVNIGAFLEVDLQTGDLAKTAQYACEVVNILFNGSHEDHLIIGV